jgi:hypothetical protein
MTKCDQQEYDCPRCRGTGCYSLVILDDAGTEINGVSEGCRACGKTGRVTREQWDEWCRVAYHMSEAELARPARLTPASPARISE